MSNGQWFIACFLIILEVNMKSSQSKFSNKKPNSGTESSKATTATSGCCCGSRYSEEIEETEVEEEK